MAWSVWKVGMSCPLGNGLVLIGMGERTSPQAVSQIANTLFTRGVAKNIIAAQFPQVTKYDTFGYHIQFL